MQMNPLDAAILEPLWFNYQDYSYISSPTQLKVEVVNVHKACLLNAQWHSRFPIIKWGNVVRNKRSVCFHAHDGLVVYAVAIWSSPIAANRFANGQQMLELRRMAIADYAPKNTATFMLKKMRNWIFDNFNEITTLVSYQDVEAHVGTIYKADNWTIGGESKFNDWKTEKRIRANAQSQSVKIRWEYERK